MNITVYPSRLEGAIQAPSSKSYAQRVLAASLLAKGNTIIKNPSRSADVMAGVEIIRKLGATVEDFGDRWIVEGGFKPREKSLFCGEAGLGIRMFSAVAALSDQTIVLNGGGSLTTRPVQMVADALNQLGAVCQTNNGLVPIWVRGPLKGGLVEIDGSISSQLLTGLLLALPLAKQDSEIRVKNLQSRPYIDMTLEVMEKFCITGSHEDYSLFQIRGGQKYHPTEITIEGDWSGAAFLLVAAALNGAVTITGINPLSRQADRRIMDALQQTGAIITTGKDEIRVERGALSAIDFDATQSPDLFPPLAALAAHCNGTSRITGVHRLRHKESDRATALQQELGKMGVPIRFDKDQMYIQGPAKMRPATIHSHGDHRIAMAATVATLRARFPVTVEQAEVVGKSYPEFYSDLKTLGGKINE